MLVDDSNKQWECAPIPHSCYFLMLKFFSEYPHYFASLSTFALTRNSLSLAADLSACDRFEKCFLYSNKSCHQMLILTLGDKSPQT